MNFSGIPLYETELTSKSDVLAQATKTGYSFTSKLVVNWFGTMG